ncbi:MAG: hypothetical protein HZA93_05735 [Verrucomicrobia bacterium]|nr:hypothetical protein [Verrucomicrobiota bacterium]
MYIPVIANRVAPGVADAIAIMGDPGFFPYSRRTALRSNATTTKDGRPGRDAPA